jgi:transposase
MIHVQLNDKQRQELRLLARQETGHVSERIHFVLLSDQGHSPSEIARIFNYCEATVRFWLNRYLEYGVAGLYDDPRSGRPHKVTQQVEETVVKMIQDDPLKEGNLATFWTVPMLVLALVNKLGVTLSVSSVRVMLQRIGLRWGRPRLAMPTKVDPEKTCKQLAIAKAILDAGPEAAILYADESRIQLLPLIRAMWHWVGRQIRIPTPGTNDTRTLFGALNIRSGRWVHLVRERMFKEDFIAFLDHLLVAYPTGPIILIVDNFSSHTAHAVSAWLAEHPRLQLYYLPKYCSHLNPVEQIWLRLKNKIAANRLYGSMKVLLDTAEKFFTEMTPEQALTWAAIKG